MYNAKSIFDNASSILYQGQPCTVLSSTADDKLWTGLAQVLLNTTESKNWPANTNTVLSCYHRFNDLWVSGVGIR